MCVCKMFKVAYLQSSFLLWVKSSKPLRPDLSRLVAKYTIDPCRATEFQNIPPIQDQFWTNVGNTIVKPPGPVYLCLLLAIASVEP